jgi:hypothetical protein
MSIVKILWYDFNSAPITAKNTFPQNTLDIHLEYVRKKINLICENAREKGECYRDIEEIFSDSN